MREFSAKLYPNCIKNDVKFEDNKKKITKEQKELTRVKWEDKHK